MINKINLEKEIEYINNNSEEELFPEITLTIHTVNDDIEIKYLLMVDVIRDFEKALTDIVTVEFLLQIGDYIEDIYKHRSKLEATLCIKRQHKQNCIRYKALILNIDKNIADSKLQSLDKENLNKTNLIEIKMQLVPIELILIKQLEHSGIYSNETPLNVVKKSIIYELSKSKLYGSYFTINFNNYESKYKKTLDTVIIPTGTKIGKIPMYVQEKYGYYEFGSNTYFRLDNANKKDLYVWLYPIVDFDRPSKEQNIGMIYNTVKTGMNLTEISYFKDNHQLKLITDKADIAGDNYNELFNAGKGLELEYTTNNLTNTFYDINKGIDITETNFKIYTVKNNDGMDVTRNIGLTDNIANTNSVITNNKLAYLNTVVYNFSGLWGNSPDEELIYPGMPFYYIYNNKKNGLNKVMKLPGTLLKQHIVFDLNKKTMMSVFLLGVKKPLIAMEEEENE